MKLSNKHTKSTTSITNMHSWIIVATACLAIVSAKPYHDDGIILKGPSGIITKDGPIGPTGPATGGDGKYEGEGSWGGEGKWDDDDGDDGSYKGEGAWGPVAPIYIPTPAWGYESYGGKGVAIIGPKTVPALVAGPAGKVYAEGLYGAKKYW